MDLPPSPSSKALPSTPKEPPRMKAASNSSLAGQIAVVTGAGRGIGAAIATTLAGMGAHAVLCGRTSELLERTNATIHSQAGQSSVMQCDIADLHLVESVAEHVERTFGRLDILVNNAGIGGGASPLHQLPPHVWGNAMKNKLRRGVYFIRTLSPLLVPGRAC